uniref:DH domain-containing protein n=1 Tax=Romanomermis culicivorax TaxID=13658 RepID=A0A915IJS2_ROMCU
VYKEPLKDCQVEGYLLSVEPDLIFGNLEELCQVSFAFCQEFHKLLIESVNDGHFATTSVIEAVFNKFSRNVSPIAAYQAYCINYKATLEYLETIRKIDDRFLEFEKVSILSYEDLSYLGTFKTISA